MRAKEPLSWNMHEISQFRRVQISSGVTCWWSRVHVLTASVTRSRSTLHFQRLLSFPSIQRLIESEQTHNSNETSIPLFHSTLPFSGYLIKNQKWHSMIKTHTHTKTSCHFIHRMKRRQFRSYKHTLTIPIVECFCPPIAIIIRCRWELLLLLMCFLLSFCLFYFCSWIII